MSGLRREAALGPKVKGLFNLGFDLILLKSGEKRPVENGWTKAKRKTWAELEENFHGNNIGVRLGRSLGDGEGYLCVIDCDLRSEDTQGYKEMLAKLAELIPNLSSATVESGRGNGSLHIYARTKEPVVGAHKFTKWGGPDGKTKLWEIDILGMGRQAVLPPSIHPETGKDYRWATYPAFVTNLAWITIPESMGAKPKSSKIKDGDFKFEVVEVDLEWDTGLSEADRLTIQEGGADRSALMLGVAIKMVRLKMSDNEILSVLTDRGYELGRCAYDTGHANTEDRRRAAYWVWKYTLLSAKRKAFDQDAFDSEAETEFLDDSQARVQEAELVSEPLDWKEGLDRAKGGGQLKNSFKNVILILTHAVSTQVFRMNEFAVADVYGSDVPWKGVKDEKIKGIDTVRIKEWFSNSWKLEPSDDRIIQAIQLIADRNSFHPVKEWLEALPEWDGRPRAGSWLKRLCQAEAEEPYLSAISRKVLVGMIARVYQPGVKFDYVLILEGAQGIGKSRMVQALASEKWFTDGAIDITNKDSVGTMQSNWVVEFGEIVSVKRSDSNAMKAFLTRQVDRLRPSYGRYVEDFPRQSIFIGTTNDEQYLSDPTGERRYWVVKTGFCDVEGMKAERDQLFAEAKLMYEFGETLYLEKEEEAGAKRESGDRVIRDVWEDQFQVWIDRRGSDDSVEPRISRERFTMYDLLSDGGIFGAKKDLPKWEQMRLADVLRRKGFIREKKWDPKKGNSSTFWVKR